MVLSRLDGSRLSVGWVWLWIALAVVGALVGMKVVLETRLGARPYEVPTSEDILGSDATATT